MRSLLLALASSVLLTACATAGGAQRSSEASAINLTLDISRDVAFQRAVQAFVAAGLTVTDANQAGGSITAGPDAFNPATQATFRAVVVGSDSSSTVILSGAYSIKTLGIRDERMTASPRGIKKELWAKLEAVARTLRPMTEPAP